MKPIAIYGIHAVAAALNKHGDSVLELFVDMDRGDDEMKSILAAADAVGITVQRTAPERLTALADSPDHQGVVARRRLPDVPSLDELCSTIGEDPSTLLLVLDQIQDPHNLGACLRVADAAGVKAVLIPSRQSATITGTVFKVAVGAAETVPVIEAGNLVQAMSRLKEAGIWITGLTDDAPATIFETDFSGTVALVVGNEHRGLRARTREHCDFLASIPMLGTVASLNASTATAICLYEVVRQRTVS